MLRHKVQNGIFANIIQFLQLNVEYEEVYSIGACKLLG